MPKNPIVLPENPVIPPVIRRVDRLPLPLGPVILHRSQAISCGRVQGLYQVIYTGMRTRLEFQYVLAINQSDIGTAFVFKNLIGLLDTHRQWFAYQISEDAFGQKKKRKRGRFRAGRDGEIMKMRIRVPHG